MKGGSLKTIDLKQFLEAPYLDPAPNEINACTLDTNYQIYMVRFMSIPALRRFSLVFVERKK